MYTVLKNDAVLEEDRAGNSTSNRKVIRIAFLRAEEAIIFPHVQGVLALRNMVLPDKTRPLS